MDSLHSRLMRAPRGTLGCLFSMTSFTGSALDRVKQLRSAEHGHELLLFDQVEVAALMNGWMSLLDAMRTKLRTLREAGEVLFLRDSPAVPALRPLDIPLAQPRASRPNDMDAGVAGRVDNFAFGELPSSFEIYSRDTHGFQLHGSPIVDTAASATVPFTAASRIRRRLHDQRAPQRKGVVRHLGSSLHTEPGGDDPAPCTRWLQTDTPFRRIHLLRRNATRCAHRIPPCARVVVASRGLGPALDAPGYEDQWQVRNTARSSGHGWSRRWPAPMPSVASS